MLRSPWCGAKGGISTVWERGQQGEQLEKRRLLLARIAAAKLQRTMALVSAFSWCLAIAKCGGMIDYSAHENKNT
jgi:hypothetical protein